ncbi:MAG: pantoate--beta-alanine ligase [Opitutales bacterium]
MKTWDNIAALRAWRRAVPAEAGRIGFVPTMGALHRGHAALIEQARAECGIVVVSIFVNPTQFNDPEDCTAYPQPLEADLALCRELGVDGVFLPRRADLYPDGYRYRVTETEASLPREGAFRPGHFDGVLTVVLKLFQLVAPDRAYFGEKDWQQLSLVRGMAKAFFLPLEVVACPTVREADGLALSSRNVRLSPAARARAAVFPRLLAEAPSPEAACAELEGAGFAVEYVEDAEGRRLGAVVLEGVRLIDNLPLAAVPNEVHAS